MACRTQLRPQIVGISLPIHHVDELGLLGNSLFHRRDRTLPTRRLQCLTGGLLFGPAAFSAVRCFSPLSTPSGRLNSLDVTSSET